MPVTKQGYDFWQGLTLAELTRLQDARPVQRADDLLADYWPEDEIDQFTAAIEERRNKGPEEEPGQS
jgi:hypothetical protein